MRLKSPSGSPYSRARCGAISAKNMLFHCKLCDASNPPSQGARKSARQLSGAPREVSQLKPPAEPTA